jgi:hypothetical protein
MSGWVAGAIVVGAVVGAVSSKQSSDKQIEAANNASAAQERTAQQQLTELQRQYDLLREDLSSYRQLGTTASQQLQDLLTGKAETTPLTEALTRQGSLAVNRQASAQGFLNTGQQKQALQRVGQEAALQGSINPLLQLTGIGQASAAQTGAAGINTGQSAVGVLGQQGLAQQNAALLGGQARASAYQNYGNIANNALNQYLMYRGYNQGNQGSYYGSGQTSGYGSNVQGDAYAPAYGG